ncbi:MAG: hypothetical protein M1816_000692 [Peltula sp. TS41687]|nr:MAG: hypothetical protein M1816_000692 [Peltula sp. TS41687]
MSTNSNDQPRRPGEASEDLHRSMSMTPCLATSSAQPPSFAVPEVPSKRGSSVTDSFNRGRSTTNSTSGPFRPTSTATIRPNRYFPTSRNPRSGKGSSQGFAAGLGMMKKKVDPYDPEGLLTPKDDYTFLKEKQDARVAGTWTTIDPENSTRGFDEKWHEQRSQAGSSRASFTSESRYTGSPRSSSNLFPSRADGSQPDEAGSIAPKAVMLDERYENPDIDVDPEIRERFRSIDRVMDERVAPRSAFEQRNEKLGTKKASASVIKVVIGGKVAKTIEQKGDMRGQHQDRFGNYIGRDLGHMKKHLVEERQALIQLRDEEMIRATQEKRAWDAMDPDEKERHIAKRTAPLHAFLLGPGAAEEDIFEYTEIPEIYTKRVSAESIALWTAAQSMTSRSYTSDTGDDSALPTDTEAESLFMPIEDDSRGISLSDRPSSTSAASTIRAAGDRTQQHTNSGLTSSQRRTTATDTSSVPSFRPLSLISNLTSPSLAPLADITLLPAQQPRTHDMQKAELYKDARRLCSTRGRVVVVTLHSPVVFTPSALISRVFSGVLQEIQFHPRERQALLIFLFPGEADSFVRHCRAIRAHDAQRHRQMQIDADWYGGEERRAVVPIQKNIYMKVIGEEATRVLRISRIPLAKKKEEVAAEMKTLLGKILVNVALVRDPRRHIRETVGNQAIVEFASVRDAWDALVRFRDGDVRGYEGKAVAWLKDPCDRRAARSEACRCLNCEAQG